MHTESTLLRLCDDGNHRKSGAYPVSDGKRSAEPSRKIAPTTMLYADVTRVSARRALGWASETENSPAAAAHIKVFMTTSPRMNINSPANPAKPPRLAAARKSETWVKVSAPNP